MKYFLPVSKLEVDSLEGVFAKITLAELSAIQKEFYEEGGHFREWMEDIDIDIFRILERSRSIVDPEGDVFFETLFRDFRQTSRYEMLSNKMKEAERRRALVAEVEECKQATLGRLARTVMLEVKVPLELIWCPPGTFWMGSPADENGRSDDEIRHRVTLTKGFWIGKYAVTQKQWKAVMGTDPSMFKGEDLPVEQVSWEDCQEFCQRLNNRGSDGDFRLPLEAEWEYACRAGTETTFCCGGNLDTTLANFDGNLPYEEDTPGKFRETSTIVGSFPPNAWGLYDMHGNVWEWCQDWFGDYSTDSVTDPFGPQSGTGHVGRGGSWYDNAWLCRASCRGQGIPSLRLSTIGFRLARAGSKA